MKLKHALLPAVTLALTLGCSCLASAAPRVTVAQLLQKAEAGDRDAVLTLAAAGKFVFPDGSLASQVEMTPDLTDLVKQLTVRQSLYAIALYADGGLFESDPDAWKSNKKPDPVTTCVWINRAANYPLEASDSDRTLAAQLGEAAKEAAAGLYDADRSACLKGAKDWSLKK
ncbi:hypothetical protein [Paraherbaspirillum soli]|uniref:Uncharacterized protein n=1 Tax=Paraherbaspirillum soli TaxID=631222 RepID=A0ABW0M6P2_9BURK